MSKFKVGDVVRPIGEEEFTMRIEDVVNGVYETRVVSGDRSIIDFCEWEPSWLVDREYELDPKSVLRKQFHNDLEEIINE